MIFRRLPGVLATALATVALGAPVASAADSLYWGDLFNGKIAVANLDGSGIATLATGSATLMGPYGTAIDTATGRIFWAEGDGSTISFANLDGSGGGDLPTGAASVQFPFGIAIDPIGRRVYWTNSGNDTIASAGLDGSLAGDLPIATASVSLPTAIAVDPIGRRIYWTNSASNRISTAKLDGSDARDIPITGTATVDQPWGIAVDTVHGRLYWANQGLVDTISVADLDGSDASDVNIGLATLNQPTGIALDPLSGTVYWANGGVSVNVASARVEGTPSGTDLVTTTATSAGGPSLLRAPQSLAAPAVTGGSATGASLTCSAGTWGADFAASFVFRAPQRVSYQWTRDGVVVGGADALTLVADRAGDYVCQARAENRAGATVASSAAHRVAAAPGGDGNGGPGRSLEAFGANTNVTVALAAARIAKRAPVKARVSNGNGFAVRATVSARIATPIPGVRGRVRLAAVAGEIAARGTRTIALKLPASVQRALAKRGSIRVALQLVVTDPSGNRRTVATTVTVKRARR